MKFRVAIFLIGLLMLGHLIAQNSTPNIQAISIEDDDNFDGFELLEVSDNRLFVLGEHWHNIRSVPKATMKVLKYLHQEGDVRILAIEQGQSAADLINNYLNSGDTLVLRQIARNTMFWGKENYAFFQDLRAFNETVSIVERISVQSIDIEYKMESAVFIINDLIANKTIPEPLLPTIGQFQQIFEESREHREQFDALSSFYYYNKDTITSLVKYTVYDLSQQDSIYVAYFDAEYPRFETMIKDMFHGLIFDYTNANSKYKFRDKLIYGKFTDLIESNPDKGILCVIGMRHASKGSSIVKLDTSPNSPIRDKVMNIRISALYNKSFLTTDLRRLNFAFPDQLKTNDATLIKHDTEDPSLKTKKSFEYTLFINSGGNLTPFDKVFKED